MGKVSLVLRAGLTPPPPRAPLRPVHPQDSTEHAQEQGHLQEDQEQEVDTAEQGPVGDTVTVVHSEPHLHHPDPLTSPPSRGESTRCPSPGIPAPYRGCWLTSGVSWLVTRGLVVVGREEGGPRVLGVPRVLVSLKMLGVPRVLVTRMGAEGETHVRPWVSQSASCVALTQGQGHSGLPIHGHRQARPGPPPRSPLQELRGQWARRDAE